MIGNTKGRPYSGNPNLKRTQSTGKITIIRDIKDNNDMNNGILN